MLSTKQPRGVLCIKQTVICLVKQTVICLVQISVMLGARIIVQAKFIFNKSAANRLRKGHDRPRKPIDVFHISFSVFLV